MLDTAMFKRCFIQSFVILVMIALLGVIGVVCANAQGVLSPKLLRQDGATDGQRLCWTTANGYWAPCSDSGSGVTSLNGLTGATQTFADVDDTNVTVAIASTGTTHTWTLGWSGVLGLSRGGTGADLSATGGANQFVRQSSAGAVFTVGAIADADVPNSITLDNITQITTRDHGSLTGLTDDDHTQYGLLAGRSGGQTLIGGTGSGDDLTLNTTSNVTKGSYFFTDLTGNGFMTTSGGTGVVSITSPNAGTDVTADLEEETHASEHAENAADELLVESLGTACTDGQHYVAASGGVDCADITGAGLQWQDPTAYASLPTCDGSTTDYVYPITTGLYDYVLCDGSAPYRAFVGGVEVEIPPVASNWTVVNGSSGTAATADGAQGGVVLSTATSVLGHEATLRAVPSAPFKKSMLVSFYNAMATDTTGWACGAMFSTGTAATDDPQWVETIVQSGSLNALFVAHGTDFSGGGATADVVRYYASESTPKMWIQLEDDNTTKYWRVCPDGPYAQCQTLFSVARATNGTPTHYGFHCRQYSPGSAAPWQITLIGEVTQ